ncbi:unnamed protein product [Orchesella dallaii]|uniref:Uncharacterized protein n=1 Tax=Orchesella dallaii TaxID=48710 RepID=A0ABP1R644_9HEXA
MYFLLFGSRDTTALHAHHKCSIIPKVRALKQIGSVLRLLIETFQQPKKYRKIAAPPRKCTRRADAHPSAITLPSPACSLTLLTDENAVPPSIIEHSLTILLKTTQPNLSSTTSLMPSSFPFSNSSEIEPNQPHGRDRSCSPTTQGSMPAPLADALQLQNVQVELNGGHLHNYASRLAHKPN